MNFSKENKPLLQTVSLTLYRQNKVRPDELYNQSSSFIIYLYVFLTFNFFRRSSGFLMLIKKKQSILFQVILLSISLFNSQNCMSISLEKKPDLGDIIYEYSNEIFYRFDVGVSLIDSLKNHIDEGTYLHNKAYFQYSDAVIDYEEGRYNRAIQRADSALEYFLWNKQHQWESRTFLLVGYIAEAIRLHEEALEAYQISANHCDEIRTKSLAYFGLARSQKRLKQEWNEALKEGQKLITVSNSLELKLYEKQATYWFYPDSSTLPSDLDSLAKQYVRLELYARASMAKKSIARYYLAQKDYPNALNYLNQSFVLANDSSENPVIVTASILYLKGAIYQSSGNYNEADINYKKSIELFHQTDYWHINYTTYRYLYIREKNVENYELALDYNNRAMACLKRSADLNSEWSKEYTQLIKKRELIIKELKRYNRRLFILLLLAIVIISSITNYAIKTRRQKETAINDYELIKSTIGESLINVRKRKVTEYLNLSQKEIGRRIDRNLINDQNAILHIKENLAPMLLEVENTLPQLTEVETKCASLVALGCNLRDLEDLLCVKYTTVKIYRTRIRKKLNITDSKSNLQKDILSRLKQNDC